jgi:hypothetical protein
MRQHLLAWFWTVWVLGACWEAWVFHEHQQRGGDWTGITFLVLSVIILAAKRR